MFEHRAISLVDCPRDAIQGMKSQIPTHKKINYINSLLESKLFDCIDFGSLVSPKAVPQMSDTKAVLEGLNPSDVKLLAIIANLKGAEIGAELPRIDYLGYPFSISETFQMKNTNSNINQAFDTVRSIQDLLAAKGEQELVIYISMAFGNPYGDEWNMDLVLDWINQLKHAGVSNFSIADTTAEASPDDVRNMFRNLTEEFPEIPFSAHLHSQIETALLKIDAAFEAGCRRFEGAILGYGGCPFAKDELVGNIPSELLIDRFNKGTFEQAAKLMQDFQILINDEL